MKIARRSALVLGLRLYELYGATYLLPVLLTMLTIFWNSFADPSGYDPVYTNVFGERLQEWVMLISAVPAWTLLLGEAVYRFARQLVDGEKGVQRRPNIP